MIGAAAVAGAAPARPQSDDPIPAKDGRPPVALIAAATKVECDGPDGGPVELDGSASFDADALGLGEDVIVSWEWFEDLGRPSEAYLGSGAHLTTRLPIGHHRIGLRVTDATGLTGQGEITLDVVDGAPPSLQVTLEPEVLYPPDHRQVTVRAHIDARDACGPVRVSLISVRSDEPDDAPGPEDGDTRDDIRGAVAG
ncbi:MAG TPA: hypothetical protein VNI57_02620, partial [Candidatus Saccharimonadales bacterium]|nr:hypothetical protein [Candidatus Saccharimonadales bacterium]